MIAVRELLFGGQIKEINARFQALEDTLRNELKAMRDSINNRLGTLEDQLQAEVATLHAAVREESGARQTENQAVREFIDVLDQNYQSRAEEQKAQIENVRKGAQEELHQRTQALSSHLSANVNHLTGEIQSMSEQKASRADLSDMFAEFGQKLQGLPAPSGSPS